eukprot:CAMPEP_0185748070 /NCGR_PEP_ID=MMETSP1174-20130828/6723_1 /TAXON_ID=35687 /ORGANISM="Dictyocha speculum, Strain CCMP1381" /LENGTH=137 /DNA_ID=CAMNT_0028423555 /DNA_START=283 /DNA_END=696 /DNA_ORIENTATION=+
MLLEVLVNSLHASGARGIGVDADEVASIGWADKSYLSGSLLDTVYFLSKQVLDTGRLMPLAHLPQTSGQHRQCDWVSASSTVQPPCPWLKRRGVPASPARRVFHGSIVVPRWVVRPFSSALMLFKGVTLCLQPRVHV